jgi:hypothetical protein
MKLSKALPAIVLIAAIVVPGQGVARPASSKTAIPALAGTTVIVGSESAWTRVRVPRAFHWDDVISATISGDGRGLGFVLVKEVNGAIPKSPKAIDGIRFGDCFEEACAMRSPIEEAGIGAAGRGDVWPAGIYRLYLIADGAPVRVTMEFPQLDGKTTIAPRIPANAVVQSLTPRVPTTPLFYSAGDLAPFKGQGFLWFSQTLEVPGSGTAAYDWCIYHDEAPPVQATAYLPADCPGGWHNGYRPTVREYDDPGEDWLGYEVAVYMHRLPAAVGAWYSTTSPVKVGGVAAIWLKF